MTLPSQSGRPKCDVCEAELRFRWTDSHGVGVCTTCGTPYTIYHYDEATKARLDKPPEIALLDSGVEIARRYWTETKRRVFPGCFDMGILRRREATYSGATADDFNAWDEWMAKNNPPPSQPSTGDKS